MPQAAASSRDEGERRASTGLRRACSLTGTLPVGVYLVFHLWETSAAVRGRDELAARLTGARGGVLALTLETVLVLLPLAVHAATGVALAVRARGDGLAGSYASRGSRRLQWVTGALALLFIGVHLADGWVAKLGGVGPYGLYESLRERAGLPLPFAVYVVGLAAVCFHFGQGLAAALRTWAVVREGAALRATRIAAGLFAFGLWIVSLNTFAHFARGESLLWGHPPAPERAEPAAGPSPPAAR